MNTKYLRIGLIFCSYLILTLIATYPTWMNLSSSIPGPREDNQQNYWTVWWFHRAIAEEHIDPWTCQLLYYPNGAHLGLHDVGPAYTFPGTLFAALLGPVAAYNLLVLMAFPLSAFAMYLLTRNMGLSYVAAWGSGIVYGFAPYLPVHGQHHLQQTGIHWFPLLVLCLRRIRVSGSSKWIVGAVLCYAMAAYSSLYFAVFAALLSGFILLFNMWKDRSMIRVILIRISLFALLCMVVLMPRFLLVRDAMKEGAEYGAPGAMAYSADLLGIIIPPYTHPLWGSAFEASHAFGAGTPWEFEYLGVASLILAAMGLISIRQPTLWRWALLTGVFTVLSLGPLLHIGGDVVMGRPLPYALFVEPVPVLNGVRVPLRFTLLAILGLSVVAGFGIERLTRQRGYGFVGILAGFIVFVDFLQIPLETTEKPEAPAHIALVTAHPDINAFLDLPVDDYSTRMRAEYCQTVHTRPIVTGAIGRDPAHFLAILDSIPELKGVGTTWDFLYDDSNPFDSTTVVKIRQMGIGGVVVHREGMGDREDGTLHTLSSILGPPLFTNEEFLAWPVESDDRLTVSQGDGGGFHE